MFLPQRARILSANQGGLPAEDTARFVRPEKYLPVLDDAYLAYASQAARGGLEFVSILPGKSTKARPMASWKAPSHPAQSNVASISDRAAGVLEEVMKVADSTPPKFCGSDFTRRVLRCRLQC